MTFREERIGPHRLFLGDCMDVMPTLGKVDAVVTDPPYGIGLTKKTSRYDTSASAKAYDDDEATIGPLVRGAILVAIGLAPRVVVTPGTRLLTFYPQPASIGTIFSPGSGSRDSWGFACNNPILYYGKCPYLAAGKGSRPNSFASNAANPYGEGRVEGHPCPKPLAWMEWLVSRASAVQGETILDPFAGSGTTGVACQKLGRTFIGIEKDPDYFAVMCKRIDEAMRQPDLFIAPPPPAKQETLDL